MKILCVEDNKTTQTLYNILLEDSVKELVVAYDGLEGYKKFTDNDIDIIITDYDMPTMNGMDMIRKVRAVNENIPIIFVTEIKDVNLMVNALDLGVNTFVGKPIDNNELLKAIENSAKILIANDLLAKKEEQALYRKYQEDLGFAKELNILRNDFYYQMIMSNGVALVDFMYEPLDVLSGDAYSARIIDEHCTFYLVVDGMGKGLSASLTAMIMTSFINHMIDKMLATDSFDLAILINESMDYIKPVLLEEEALAIDYVLINFEDNMMYYAKFAMPVILLVDENDKIQRLKSNNAPLCKWSDTFNVDSLNISEIKKFLLYSDGIVENETISEGKTYADFIEEDFISAFTKEDLKKSFLDKVDVKEDDITFIYIHRLSCLKSNSVVEVFDTSLNEVDAANEWYTDLWDSFTDIQNISCGACLVFTELFMNAYEHGNLSIDAPQKNKMLNDDVYFETLLEKEKGCNKNITVQVSEILEAGSHYIITQITDEGEGFDTHILSEIFRNAQTFNGRGVFVSRKNSMGIYYNDLGNHVLFLSKIK